MYADDILLMSASVVVLQSMLDICYKYGQKHDIVFNCDKSFCMTVGCKWRVGISNMLLNDTQIAWVNNIKFLGMVLKSGANFQVDCAYIKRKFYVACNSVLAGCKYADEFVKLSLVKSKCLPLLTYCLGALVLTQSKVRDLGVCWNDCFRKIFKYNRWESVSELQQCCREPSFQCIYDKSRLNFLTSANTLKIVWLVQHLT